MLHITSSTNLNLLIENLIFSFVATAFLVIVGWAWRHLKPFDLPQPLPGWYKIWFLTAQLAGASLPVEALLLWGVWKGFPSVLTVFLSYFAMLGLQILSEIATLRWFQSVVWVMVPYLYLPYRIWQLYEGLMLLEPESDLMWVQYLLILEIILWTLNYGLDLAQLPRLFRWQTNG